MKNFDPFNQNPMSPAGGAQRSWLDASLSRKGFLRLLGAAVVFLAASAGKAKRSLLHAGTTLEPRKRRAVSTACDMTVVKGESPAAITRKAVDELGGIKQFVRKGDVVVVKPNIGWDRVPEMAANTNPQVVATLGREDSESIRQYLQ